MNKTDSAVRITHIPTKTVVQCQNERSQSSNKQTAMKLLRSKLIELEERRRREELAREKGEAAGRRLGIADPLVRAAPLHDGQGPPHRLRDGRRRARARRRPRRLRARVPREERGRGRRFLAPLDRPQHQPPRLSAARRLACVGGGDGLAAVGRPARMPATRRRRRVHRHAEESLRKCISFGGPGPLRAEGHPDDYRLWGNREYVRESAARRG